MYRVVVADDEYIVVEGIKALMKRLKLNGEIVGSAHNGIDALEVIQETQPDLVITDIRMPGLDGLSLIESCQEVLPDTLYVIISGYTEFEYARKALFLGVINYIDKPITISKLKEVFDLLEQKTQQAPVIKGRISQKLSQIIDLLVKENPAGLKSAVEDMLKLLGQSFQNMESYRNEVFKFLAVMAEICNDQNPNQGDLLQVSYHELEGWRTRAEVEAYAFFLADEVQRRLCGRSAGSSHRIVRQMIRYIEDKYGENVGLNEFARQVEMNPAYLSILFKEEVGTSYVKYLTDYRMKKAREFLAQGMKVVEVSERVGYVNYRYFCEIFKKREGKTPNEYRGCTRKR